MSEHPDAFYMLEIPYTAVWAPPEEPRDEGVDWHRRPAILRAHRERVRKSLETFINEQISGLDHMLRTGWFIIERARVAVTEFREVPHRPEERAASPVKARARRAKGSS